MNTILAILSIFLFFTGTYEESDADRALRENGGTVAVYEVQASECDEAFDDGEVMMDAAREVFLSRLLGLSYSDADVEILKNNRLKVIMPRVDSIDSVASALQSNAMLEFLDSSGNVFMNSKHISSAEATYENIGSGIANEYCVVVEFTQEGKELFSKATAEAASRSDTGENYIDIVLDGYIISRASVQQKIVSDTVMISGGFSMKSAIELATLINSSKIPMEFVLVEYDFFEPSDSE